MIERFCQRCTEPISPQDGEICIDCVPAAWEEEHTTFLEDFGFDFIDQGTGVEFIKVRESVAKYPDGVARDWQGTERFSRPKVRI